ncbi:MAG: transcriptional repressor [Myxococcales bacterium]|nr:transcriptional repressor [Myxococcales bacterium]MCB9737345.1 transcriptional repressor [Deltaproteobacteria bacterium]
MSAEAHEKDAPELYDRLVARGWRMTPQRRVVAQTLHGLHLHLTAEEVFRRAQVALPEISLATVYNTLNDLVTMGEVREVVAGRGPVRYDPNTVGHHDHLVCVDCGELWDVAPVPSSVRPREADLRGYDLVEVDVVFRGRCGPCRDAAEG